jgi:hypothetical protein
MWCRMCAAPGVEGLTSSMLGTTIESMSYRRRCSFLAVERVAAIYAREWSLRWSSSTHTEMHMNGAVVDCRRTSYEPEDLRCLMKGRRETERKGTDTAGTILAPKKETVCVGLLRFVRSSSKIGEFVGYNYLYELSIFFTALKNSKFS